MSIMVGVTTNKFLMIGAALCLPMRVNHERVLAVIDDNVPISVISTELAERLHIRANDGSNAPIDLRKPIHVSIGAEEFSMATLLVSDTPFEGDAHRGRDVILGDDMLRTTVLDLDFVHGKIRLILPGERQRYIKGFDPVALTEDANGRADIDLARYRNSHIILDEPHRTFWVAR